MSRPYPERLKRKVIALLLRHGRRDRDAHRAEMGKLQGEIFDNLTRLVGRFAIEWAVMEMHLDRSIEFLHQNGGAGIVQSDLPVSIKNKVAYLRKAARLFDEKWHRQIGKLCDDLNRIRALRSDLLHGVASTYVHETGGWDFARSKFDKDQRLEIETSYPLDAITAGVLDVVKLGGRLSVFLALTKAEFDPEYRRYLERQLPVG